MITFTDLVNRANAIKNEVQSKANTSLRVGSWMADLLEWINGFISNNKGKSFEVTANGVDNEFLINHEMENSAQQQVHGSG